MHLLVGGELFLEWSWGDNFDSFYGGPNTYTHTHTHTHARTHTHTHISRYAQTYLKANTQFQDPVFQPAVKMIGSELIPDV